MAYDALSLSVLAKEFADTLIGGKITKIYQPEKDEIVLFVFNKRTFKLLISANAGVNRIHITDASFDNPKTAPSFCMLLRKHITNATVTSVCQMPYERVLDFGLSVSDELGYRRDMRLIFELTGKTSNIILTDDNYITLDSIKHLPQDLDGKRLIMSGAKYTFFLPQNKIPPFDYEKVALLLAETKTPLRKTLPEKLLGVSQTTVNEILYGIDENDHTALNNSLIVERLREYERGLNNPKPNVALKDGVPQDAYPFEYRSAKGEKTFYSTLNEAHDDYYRILDKTQRFASKAKSVSTVVKNAISRTEKKLALQRQSVLEANNRETYKQYGDLILSNLWKIKKDDETLACVNYYDNSETVIPLDKTLTPQQNAQAYYKKYRKLKSSAEHNGKLVEENQKLLDYLITIKNSLAYCAEDYDLQLIKEELQAAGLIKEKQQKKKTETPVKPLRYLIDGYAVYAGKNNAQNNFVTFKLSKPDDIWLHTQKIHSSHVLIVNDKNGEVPFGVIEKAAEIAAYYSQAKSGTKIPVDYTPKANVKKPPKSPLGFVIYQTYQTVLVNPNRHLAELTDK
ncbi:MAG: NFACT family protein [Firmicutes bacterium]|nr:NFACT family protein [Bacillota bacterium]